jgi:drug/metabolite transporter (DMT)-like permease
VAERKASHFGLYLLILAMTLMWSANYITSKIALRDFPPLLLVGLRNAMAAAMMLAVYVRYLRNGGSVPHRRDFPKLIGLGLVGIAINQMLFVSGMALTTVAHAAITIGLTPMVVLMLAAAIGQERLSAARMAGMAVALAGVAVLQLAPDNAKGASLLGDVLVFSGGFLFALFTVHSKAQATRIDGITLNTFAYVSGAAALLPVTVWLSLGHPFERVTGAAWLRWDLPWCAT